jgi:hypothetical protein
MTPDEVRERVAAIRNRAHDPEGAHADEDNLWMDVLTAISGGADNPADLAREAVKSNEIDFTRWYA